MDFPAMVMSTAELPVDWEEISNDRSTSLLIRSPTFLVID